MAFSLASAFVEFSTRGGKETVSTVDSINGAMKKLGLNKEVERLGGMFDGLKGHIMALLSPTGLLMEALGALGLGLGVGSMVKGAAEVEKTRAEFALLTGSVESAKEVLGKLKETFLGTDISPEAYKSVAAEMLSTGESAEQVQTNLKMIGNIAIATKGNFEEMASALHRAEVSGKLSMRTFMAMPAVTKELANEFGVDDDAIKKMADDGKLGVDHLRHAMEMLGGEGGKWGNALETQKNTLIGRFEILQGKLKGIFNKIGEGIITAFDLPGVVAKLSGWIDWFSSTYGKTIDGVFADIGVIAGNVWDWISKQIGDFAAIFQQHFGGVQDAANAGWNAIKSGGKLVAAIFEQLAEYAKALFDAYMSIVYDSGLVEFFYKIIGGVVELASELVSSTTHSQRFAGMLDLIKSVGYTMGQILKKAIEGITIAWQWLMNNPVTEWFINVGKVAYDAIDKDLGGILNFCARFIEGIGDVLADWDLWSQLLGEHFMLFVDNCSNRLTSWWSYIGKLLDWFTANWTAVFEDAYNYVKTVFTNLANNIKALWDSLWTYMQTGSFNFDWTDLEQGFKSVAEKLPGFVEAEWKESNKRIDQLNKELDDRAAERAKKRAKQPGAGGAAGDNAAGGKGAPGAPGGPPALLPGKGGAGANNVEFTSFSGLWDKMQQEAFKSDIPQQQLAVAQQQVVGINKVAEILGGEGIRIKPDHGGHRVVQKWS